MGNFKKRNELYKKWSSMRDTINKNVEVLPYQKVQELRKQEKKLFDEWKKLELLEKLKERRNENENNIRKEK